MSDRITLAQIPAGQPLDVFGALCGFFGAAIDGAVLAPGDGGRVAARVLAEEGLTPGQLADLLRRATARAQGDRTPPPPAADADDEATAIERLSITEDGVQFSVTPSQFAQDFARDLAGIFLPALDAAGAQNYLEYDLVDPDSGKRMCLIVVRPGGESPHDLRAQAEAEAARLRALLAEHGIEDPEGGRQ